jgi:hypothetical protein
VAPGKPQILLRQTTHVLSQLFSKHSVTLLPYKDALRARQWT